MDRPTVAVVLAGGTGTRLYPASRSDRPKQFLDLGGDRSLLVRAVERGSLADRRVVLTAPRLADRTREHLRAAGYAVREWGSTGDPPDPGECEGTDGDPGDRNSGDGKSDDLVELLVEPEPKDTGPALAYAAARIRAGVAGATGEARGVGDATPGREGNGEPVLCCLPADHHVEGDFGSVAGHAIRVAGETRGLVTVGVEPTRPATGYGYVEPRRFEDGYAPVESFHEKPDAERARGLIDAGCLWNAGVFAWTPSALLREARGTALDPIVEAAEAGNGANHDLDRRADHDLDRALREAYAAVDPVSVDYAVMEHTEDVFVVPARGIEWDDLGTWDALARVLDADDAGNAVLGEALCLDARGTVVASEDHHVTAIGVDDLVVAADGDRVLVVPAAEADRVREAVDRLRDDDLF